MQSVVRAESTPDASPAEKRSRLFLLYHELREGGSDYSYVVDTAIFERQASLFAALQADANSFYPELTFDDGHSSNLHLAAPVLQRHGLKARFFVTVGWTGRRPGFMDWQQLRTLLAGGHSIGAHGWSHKLLTHCSDLELYKELKQARLTLEDGLGVAITAMSLPGGRANTRVLAACREAGYTQVFTSEPKAERSPLGERIGRFNVHGYMQPEWLAQLLQPQSGVLRSIERQHRLKTLVMSVLGDALYSRLWALKNRREPDAADQWEPTD
jgi:peptidoglycan/xylan/chitin deacetylase (PgdA/CDA1 family)